MLNQSFWGAVGVWGNGLQTLGYCAVILAPYLSWWRASTCLWGMTVAVAACCRSEKWEGTLRLSCPSQPRIKTKNIVFKVNHEPVKYSLRMTKHTFPTSNVQGRKKTNKPATTGTYSIFNDILYIDWWLMIEIIQYINSSLCLKHVKTYENHVVEVLETSGAQDSQPLEPHWIHGAWHVYGDTVLGRRWFFLEPKLCQEDLKVSTSFDLSENRLVVCNSYIADL